MGQRTILLGAGASMDAGLPGAKDLTRKTYVRSQAIDLAIGGLQFFRATTGGEPFGDLDVEDIYSTLLLLSARHTHLLGRFVSAWHPHVLAAEAGDRQHSTDRFVNTLAEELHTVVTRAHNRSGDRPQRDWFNRPRVIQDLERIVRPDSKVFRDAASELIERLSQCLWVRDAAQVNYLGPWLETARSSPLWIATLNYDNTIEVAADHLGLSVDHGIGKPGGNVSFHDGAAICLAKLHGSLNWHDEDGEVRVDPLPVRWPALIFGAENKLQIEGPYLDLMFQFREQLQRSAELVVCGYSFRDAHINHLLLKWLGADRARTLHVIDPWLTGEHIAANVDRSMSRSGRSYIRDPWSRLENKVNIRNINTKEWAKAGGPT